MLEHPLAARRKQQAEEAERQSRRTRRGLRPSSGRSSGVFAVALLAGIYIAALASIAPLMLSTPSTFKGAAIIPFR